MRVSDAQIMRAIWLNQLRATAAGATMQYVGGYRRVAPPSWQHYGQDCHIMSRERLGIPLSSGHLRKRLMALIGVGGLVWATRSCTFYIKNEQADAAWEYARQWWADQGVPVERGDLEAPPAPIIVEDFGAKAALLEFELLERFGGAA